MPFFRIFKCVALLVVTSSGFSFFIHAEEEGSTVSLQGKVVFPEEIPAGISDQGLEIGKVIVKLEGKVNFPRRPYPNHWRDMSAEERKEWLRAFQKTEAFREYHEKVELARANRLTLTTDIADDGTFVFKNVTPAWYQLTAWLMHPEAKGETGPELARGRALRQFFVKDHGKPFDVGELTMKIKNVPVPGEKAFDWTAQSYDGGADFKLSGFQGKYILFDIWATWCGPCLAELPNLEAVSKEFAGERFEVVGLSIDQTMEAADAFLKKKGSSYRQGYFGNDDRFDQIRNAYGIEGIPSIWLIDPDGKIVARDLRGEGIRRAVEAALAR